MLFKADFGSSFTHHQDALVARRQGRPCHGLYLRQGRSSGEFTMEAAFFDHPNHPKLCNVGTSCPRQMDFPSTIWILMYINVWNYIYTYVYITYIASTDYNFLSRVCDDSPNEHLVDTAGTGFVAAQTMAKKGRWPWWPALCVWVIKPLRTSWILVVKVFGS